MLTSKFLRTIITLTDSIEINGESKIVLNRVASKSPLNSVPVIVKNPLIVAEGNTKFDKSNFYGDMRYIPLTCIRTCRSED